MAATREDIDSWIAEAISDNQEFIISVCDTFDWEDYPVYCKDKKELLLKYPHYDGKNMQKVNEIIQIKNGKAQENLKISNIQFNERKKRIYRRMLEL